MQKSRYQRAARFLRRAWLLIAAVLWLGQTSALAESYIRVFKKGVVYYHFPIREHPRPGQVDLNPPALPRLPSASRSQGAPAKTGAYIPAAHQPDNLATRLINAAMGMEATGNAVDVRNMEDEVKEGLEIILAEAVGQVLDAALVS